MADLNNLLGELEAATSSDDATTVESIPEAPREDEEDLAPPPEVPPALEEAIRARDQTPFSPDFDDHKVLDIRGDDSGGENEEEDQDYAHLKRLWKQEMLCPDLLPYDTDLVSLQAELLEGQEESIDQLLERASSRESNVTSLIASVYQMDANRASYMLSDLLATRLTKIEDHPLHMREMVSRMSENEVRYPCIYHVSQISVGVLTSRLVQVSYLKGYGELLESHFNRSVLDHFPKKPWRKLDEPEMIDRPNMDRFVFCKALETVEINNHDPLSGEEQQSEFNIQEHQTGECLIVRYNAIRELVLEGKVEILL